MKQHQLQDDLQDGFEPSDLPPIGPDGAPALQPIAGASLPRPSLCAAGPCVNYHTFSFQLDVTRSLGERVLDGGKIEGASSGMPFHVRRMHYCYPAVGVESDLGDLPIIECSRWRPVDPAERAALESARDTYLASEDGKAFKTAVDAWLAAQQEDLATDGEIAAAAATDPEPSPQE